MRILTYEKSLIYKFPEIAKEWDEMEFALQNNELWYFLTSDKNYPTRIELLFEVFCKDSDKDEFATYRFFAKQEKIVKVWNENEYDLQSDFESLEEYLENYGLNP